MYFGQGTDHRTPASDVSRSPTQTGPTSASARLRLVPCSEVRRWSKSYSEAADSREAGNSIFVAFVLAALFGRAFLPPARVGLAADFFAFFRNSAQRLLAASMIRLRPAALILRFRAGAALAVFAVC